MTSKRPAARPGGQVPVKRADASHYRLARTLGLCGAILAGIVIFGVLWIGHGVHVALIWMEGRL